MKKLLSAIVCIFMCTILITPNILAIELGAGGTKRFTSGHIILDDNTMINGQSSFGDFVFLNIPEGRTVQQMQINFQNNLPNDYAVTGTFTVTYDFIPASIGAAGSIAVENIKYFGLDLSDATILNDSCTSSTLASSINGSEGTLTCTYLILTSFLNQSGLNTANGRIFSYRSAGYNAKANIIVSNFSYRAVNWNSLTSDDRTWLENILQQTSSGNGDTAQALQEVQDKAQDAANQGDTNAQNSGSDNENATDNLFTILGEIVGALSAPATNCRLDANFGHVDLGQIDYCSGKPNEFVGIINVVVIISMCLAIWGICVSLIHDFISLTRFAQGG